MFNMSPIPSQRDAPSCVYSKKDLSNGSSPFGVQELQSIDDHCTPFPLDGEAIEVNGTQILPKTPLPLPPRQKIVSKTHTKLNSDDIKTEEQKQSHTPSSLLPLAGNQLDPQLQASNVNVPDRGNLATMNDVHMAQISSHRTVIATQVNGQQESSSGSSGYTPPIVAKVVDYLPPNPNLELGVEHSTLKSNSSQPPPLVSKAATTQVSVPIPEAILSPPFSKAIPPSTRNIQLSEQKWSVWEEATFRNALNEFMSLAVKEQYSSIDWNWVSKRHDALKLESLHTKKDNLKLKKKGAKNGGTVDTSVMELDMKHRNAEDCYSYWICHIRSKSVLGNWSKSEDDLLCLLIGQYGAKRWGKLSDWIFGRRGKQCRERWMSRLDPTLNHGSWSQKEIAILLTARKEYNNSWAKIAKFLPGRSDTMVTNMCNAMKRQEAALLKKNSSGNKTNVKQKQTKSKKKKKTLQKQGSNPIDVEMGMQMLAASPMRIDGCTQNYENYGNKSEEHVLDFNNNLEKVPSRKRKYVEINGKKLKANLCPVNVVPTNCKSGGDLARYGVKLKYQRKHLRIGSSYCDPESASKVATAFKKVARIDKNSNTIYFDRTGLQQLEDDDVYTEMYRKWKKNECGRVLVADVLKDWLQNRRITSPSAAAKANGSKMSNNNLGAKSALIPPPLDMSLSLGGRVFGALDNINKGAPISPSVGGPTEHEVCARAMELWCRKPDYGSVKRGLQHEFGLMKKHCAATKRPGDSDFEMPIDSSTYSFAKGHMHVCKDCAPPGVDLNQLQKNLMALPKKFFSKNGRNSLHKQGQSQGGFTCQAGQQTPQVYGLNAPYQNKNQKDLIEKFPHVHDKIAKVLTFMWSKVCCERPVEAANMMETSSELRLGDTGFSKYSFCTNFKTIWHIDKTNQQNGVQAVFVLGNFSGGELCIDPSGRTKVNKNVSKTNGQESDIIEIKCSHGTLFIGDYKSLWHTVKPILSGSRTILAAYCRNDVAKFDRVARSRGGMAKAFQLRDTRLSIRRMLQKLKKKNKGHWDNIKKLKKKIKGHWDYIDKLECSDQEHSQTCEEFERKILKQIDEMNKLI